MTTQNFPTSVSFTLKEEGGWSDRPDDTPTNHGITLATYQHYFPHGTKAELHATTAVDASAIYHSGYWNAMRGDDLPGGPDLMVFDFGVNAGPGTSIRLLQRAVNVIADGMLGPVSMAAIAKASPSTVIAALAGLQRAHYRSLAAFDTFGVGWIARLERRQALALTMIPKLTKEPT